MGNIISSLDYVGTKFKSQQIIGYKCRRCGGTGFIGRYRHVANGRCFSCNGSGATSNKYYGSPAGFSEPRAQVNQASLKKRRWYVASALKDGKKIVLSSFTDISMKNAISRFENIFKELRYKPALNSIEWGTVKIFEGELMEGRSAFMKRLKVKQVN